MQTLGEREIRFEELSRRDRRQLCWGCYLQTIKYVLVQTIVMVPLALFLSLNPEFFAPSSPLGSVIGLLLLEAVSFGLGFLLVATFTRNLFQRRFGRLRFALMVPGS